MPSDLAAATPEQAEHVAQIARAYLWWEPVGGKPHGFARQVAQIMNFGTYRDILRLEAAVDDGLLSEVMRGAQPGWFDGRSWSLWRGRLAHRAGATLPEAPPKRRLPDAARA